jgi:hypothetical protein
LDAAHRTQVWLAVSDEGRAAVSGQYFYHMQLRTPKRQASAGELQESLIETCKRLSGVELR